MTHEGFPRMSSPYQLAILVSHPTQFESPLYAQMTADGRVVLTVYFWSTDGTTEMVDPELGHPSGWDFCLTAGYAWAAPVPAFFALLFSFHTLPWQRFGLDLNFFILFAAISVMGQGFNCRNECEDVRWSTEEKPVADTDPR